MNNTRRKRLNTVIEILTSGMEIIEQVEAEEQECFDNMNEGLQATERGQQIEQNIYELDDIRIGIEDLIDRIYQL